MSSYNLWYRVKDIDDNKPDVIGQGTTFCREVLLTHLNHYLYERSTQHKRTLQTGYIIKTVNKIPDEYINNAEKTLCKLYGIDMKLYNNKTALYTRYSDVYSNNGVYLEYTSPNKSNYITRPQLSSILFLLKCPTIRRLLLSKDTTEDSIDTILQNIVSKTNISVPIGQLLSTILYIKFVDKLDKNNTANRSYYNGCHSFMTAHICDINYSKQVEYYRYSVDILSKLNDKLKGSFDIPYYFRGFIKSEDRI